MITQCRELVFLVPGTSRSSQVTEQSGLQSPTEAELFTATAVASIAAHHHTVLPFPFQWLKCMSDYSKSIQRAELSAKNTAELASC